MKGISLAKAENWLLESYSGRIVDLAVFRILFATSLLLIFVPKATWLESAPKAFFNPPISIPAIFQEFPSFTVILFFNGLLAVFLAMLLVGWRTKLASIGTSIFVMLLCSWDYSLGKINHDILLVLVPLVMAFSGWGNAYSLDARKVPATSTNLQSSPSLAILALLIGLGMFSSGWEKLLSGWLDPSTRSTYGFFLHYNLDSGRESWFTEWMLSMDSFVIWEGADWLATLFELGFLVALIHRQSMCIWIAMGAVFHLGVWLLFDIVFWWNLLAYAAFIRYTELPGFRQLKSTIAFTVTNLKMVFISALLLGFSAIWAGKSIESLINVPLQLLIIFVGGAVGFVYLLHVGMKCILYLFRDRHRLGAKISTRMQLLVAKSSLFWEEIGLVGVA
jgi:hypothetical protein